MSSSDEYSLEDTITRYDSGPQSKYEPRENEASVLSVVEFSKIPSFSNNSRSSVESYPRTAHGRRSKSLGTLKNFNLFRSAEEDVKIEEDIEKQFRSIFKSLDLHGNGKVDLINFSTAVKLLGFTQMGEQDIADLFDDCRDSEDHVNIRIEKLLSALQNQKTVKIQKFIASYFNKKPVDCVGRTGGDKEYITKLEKLVEEYKHKILRLEVEKTKLQVTSEALLAEKNKQISILERSLKNATLFQTMQYESGSSRMSETSGLQEIRSLKEELNQLRMKSFTEGKEFNDKLIQETHRANKYKTKYETLKSEIKGYNLTLDSIRQQPPGTEAQISAIYEMRKQPRTQKVTFDNMVKQFSLSPRPSEEITRPRYQHSGEPETKETSHLAAKEGESTVKKGEPNERFFWRQKLALGKSGKKKCLTHWKFPASDGKSHNLQLVHTQTPTEDMEARRIVRVDGHEQYNKKSTASNFHLQIDSEPLCVKLIWKSGGRWDYQLLINNETFDKQRRRYLDTK